MEGALGFSPFDAEDKPAFGDANGDGKVNTVDALLLIRQTIVYQSMLDLNLDGVVDSIDGAILYQWCIAGKAGSVKVLPFCEDEYLRKDISMIGWLSRITAQFTPPIFNPESPSPEGTTGLDITSRWDPYTFGYWESPALIIPDSGTSFGLLTCEVESSEDDPAKVPGFRVRFNDPLVGKAIYAVVDSQGDGANSPTNNPKVYNLPIPPSMRYGGISFDLLDFNPADSRGIELTARNFRVGEMGVASHEFTLERAYTATDFARWKSVVTAQFGHPSFVMDDAGLNILPRADGTSFGFWTSDDVVIQEQDASVFIGRKSLEKINGATIDYKEALTGAGFIVANPNATSVCGCGKSFR